MEQSQNGSHLEILVTVEVRITSTPITETDSLCFCAVMVYSPRDFSSLSYTLNAQVLSANECFRSEKVSDASLETVAVWRLY